MLHHRERAQGIAVGDDGVVALSLSYGNADSEIAFYRLGDSQSLLQGPGRTALPDGASVRSWTLSEANRVGPVLRAPPGSEGVTWINGRLAVVFEGGAYPYRTRWARLEDRVLVLDPRGILE